MPSHQQGQLLSILHGYGVHHDRYRDDEDGIRNKKIHPFIVSYSFVLVEERIMLTG